MEVNINMTDKKKTDYTPKSKRTGRTLKVPEIKDFGVIRPPRLKANRYKK